MRFIALAAACVFALAAASAHAAGGDSKVLTLSSRECGLSTPFNVQVDGGGVWLYRRDGVPKEIFFHNGILSVDHEVRTVSAADAQRLRQMEAGARTLMPAVADVARESINMTFDVLDTTLRTMTNSKGRSRKVERARERALEHVDGSLGKGRWDQEVFDARFEANVEQAAEKIANSISRSALWAVVTGRSEKLDERAERLDDEMDDLLGTRNAEIERRAQALCTQVTALRTWQDALEYRYDGAPLVMLAPVATPASSAERGDADARSDDPDHPPVARDVR